jgi:hypothetical protein
MEGVPAPCGSGPFRSLEANVVQGTGNEPAAKSDHKEFRSVILFVAVAAAIFAGALVVAVGEADIWRVLVCLGLMTQTAPAIYVIKKVRAIKG